MQFHKIELRFTHVSFAEGAVRAEDADVDFDFLPVAAQQHADEGEHKPGAELRSVKKLEGKRDEGLANTGGFAE